MLLMSFRWGRTVITAMVLIGAVACTGGDDDGASSSTSTTEAETSTTTTTEPSTTTSALSTDDQLRQTVVDLLETRNEILMNPDPARVEEWLSPECSCFQFEHDQVANLAAAGHHYGGKDFILMGVRVSDRDPQAPIFTVALRTDAFPVLDASGTEVDQVAPLDPRGISVIIARREGLWMVIDLTFLAQLEPEVLNAVIAEGLP